MAHVPVLQPHVHAHRSLSHSRTGHDDEIPYATVAETRARLVAEEKPCATSPRAAVFQKHEDGDAAA